LATSVSGDSNIASQPEAMQPSAARLRRQRVILLLIFGMAVLPFGLATLYYAYAQGDRSIATSNNGRFLKPTAHVADLQLQTLSGPEFAQHKWRLLLLRPNQCIDACAKAEHDLRAMPLLLGRDAPRVQIALVTRDETIIDSGPPVTVLRAKGQVQNISDGLLLVDPLDNVVLWYSYAQVAKPLLEDMRHLLKVSGFG
jgi:hypothetical protein